MQFIALGKATQLTLGTGGTTTLDSVMCPGLSGLYNGHSC